MVLTIEFLRFIVNPNLALPKLESWKVLSLGIPVLFIVNPLFFLLIHFTVGSTPDRIDYDSNLSPLNVIIFMLLISVAEEFIFRLPLVMNLVNAVTGLFFAIILLCVRVSFNPSGFVLWDIWILFPIIITLIAFLYRDNHFQQTGALVYFSALFFAGLHLSNHKETTSIAILYVVPQFFSALVFSYVRIKSGLISSIIAHITFNSVPALLYFSARNMHL